MKEEKEEPKQEEEKKEEKEQEPKAEEKEKEGEKKEEEPKKDDKEEEHKKEEPKEEEDPLNWREELKKEINFSQDVPFDFKQVAYKMEKASKKPDKLNPYYTISAIFDCTKVFYSISSALSMGFSDITEKCGIMRERFKECQEATDIQNLLEIEMKNKNVNLYKLNGDNNAEYGYGRGVYKNYISACRTFLRLLWFLEYLIDVFDSMLKDDGSGAMKTILGNSYDKVLAPHHPFLVKKAVGLALLFSSAGNVTKNVDIIFGYKNYNNEARKAIQSSIDLMKIVWKGGHDFYEKHKLLDLK